MSADLRISVDDALKALAAAPYDYVELFKRHDFSIEFYVPREVDPQAPHDRDEVYVIVSGHGEFVRAGQRTEFKPGDVLFVEANVPHRFENFGHDFATWVFFFGPPR